MADESFGGRVGGTEGEALALSGTEVWGCLSARRRGLRGFCFLLGGFEVGDIVTLLREQCDDLADRDVLGPIRRLGGTGVRENEDSEDDADAHAHAPGSCP